MYTIHDILSSCHKKTENKEELDVLDLFQLLNVTKAVAKKLGYQSIEDIDIFFDSLSFLEKQTKESGIVYTFSLNIFGEVVGNIRDKIFTEQETTIKNFVYYYLQEKEISSLKYLYPSNGNEIYQIYLDINKTGMICNIRYEYFIKKNESFEPLTVEKTVERACTWFNTNL